MGKAKTMQAEVLGNGRCTELGVLASAEWVGRAFPQKSATEALASEVQAYAGNTSSKKV